MTVIAKCYLYPLFHYTYSYLDSYFGREREILGSDAQHFLSTVAYTRLLYQDPVGDIAELIGRIGADLETPFRRDIFRSVIDEYCEQSQYISRKNVVLLPYVAYAVATGRDLEAVRYVLVSDAISRRTESVVDGFSGKVVDEILKDFPEAKLVHITRDPRATFASPRHQFVNSLGNMYGVSTSSITTSNETTADARFFS